MMAMLLVAARVRAATHRQATWMVIGGLLCLVAASRPANAQTLSLSLSPSTFFFASADPDTTPSISSGAITVSYRVRNNTGGNWAITLLAGGDLSSGSDAIPAGNVTWTATPAPPFQNGTLSNSVSQTLASGSGNVNPTATGTVTFSLANSWSYNVGIYAQTVVFTLTAP